MNFIFLFLFLITCVSDREIGEIHELPGSWHGNLNFEYLGIEADTTAGIQLYFLNEYKVKGWTYHGGGFINYGKNSIDECAGFSLEGNVYKDEDNIYYTDCMNIADSPGLCAEIYFYGEEVNANIKLLTIDLVSFTMKNYRDLTNVYHSDMSYNDGNQFYCIY